MSNAIPTDTIDSLEAVWQSVSALGADLDERDWNLPTELPGWTVHDNLAHLIGTERMLQGLPPAPVAADVGEHVRNPMGELNEAEVQARRGSSHEELLAEWNEIVALRLVTLREADEEFFARKMATPVGPGTMTDLLIIRVLDCWIHEQDMRRGVGRPGHRAGPAAELTIDRLLRTVPVVVGKRAATPEHGAVVIDITGDVQRHVVCEVTNGRGAIVTAPTYEPLTTITVDSEAFLLLATGRRPPTDLNDRIHIAGDTSLGQRVVDNLNMMI